MKRFTQITTLLVATAALSASALAQNGATSSAGNGASPSGSAMPSGAPMDGSGMSGMAGGSSVTTSVEQTQTTTDTPIGEPGMGGEAALPATGGEPMVFVLGGIALMGTALVMRRKATNFS